MNYEELYNKGMEKLREHSLDANREFGAETGASIKKDRDFLDSLSFEMRLIDSREACISTNILGYDLKTPIMPGAMSGMGPLADDPLVAVARGVKEAGSMMWVGICSSSQLERVINTGVPTVKIIKPYQDDELIIKKLKEAEDMGAVAVGIDIDFFFGGKRKENILMPEAMAPRSVNELREFKDMTDLPFIIKGILSVSDAVKALEIGAEAIVISSHGQAVLDHAVTPLKILPDIIKEVNGKTEVLVDSGFKRGTDVLKALALGAKGVLMGKQIMLGLAADPDNGVYEILSVLNGELRRAMSITGCENTDRIDSSILKR